MVLAIKEVNGFEKGKKYTRDLKLLSCFKNDEYRVVALGDKDGNVLYWTTTKNSPEYQNFRIKATYTFKVSYISTVFDPSTPKVVIAELNDLTTENSMHGKADQYKLNA
ncbi:hypothetical protein [Planococcus donghaensis]|uniref:Uncharacterized protein n=1 Tax=Planococcus donghaensis TaxID=414778 RepID=A0A1C7ELD5_9BACL|nr:hypothetical protein [Planococcus donghaensis]ANU24187.1 hypothetical protein BCM40_12860 [Planococcus donghaensis]